MCCRKVSNATGGKRVYVAAHHVSSFQFVDAAVHCHTASKGSVLLSGFTAHCGHVCVETRQWFGLALIVALKPFIVGHAASVNGHFCCHLEKRARGGLESKDRSFPSAGFGSNTSW